MNNKNFLVFLVSILFLLAVFAFANTSEAATPNFNTGLGVSSGYKINFVANSDGVTWTNGTGGSINASNYTGTASSSVYALTAGSVTNASTANALADNGSNCAPGNYPLGIDAAGNVEGCTGAGGGSLGGSGTINYISKWSGATGLTNSLIFDNGTNVGIGLTNPGAKLDVSGGSIRTTNQLISTVAAGTAPLAVTSNTIVSNLNADLLDGSHAAALSVLYATSAGSATSALTANALAGNGTNCSAGYYPLGIDDKGDVESCTADLGADNLGDHVMAQNIITHGNWISGDGDSEGLFVSSLGAVAISTSSITTTLNLGGRSGNDGIKFPDGTLQTTAFTGLATTMAAANVSAGEFGRNVGGGTYSFPTALGIGINLPQAMLHIQEAAGTSAPSLLVRNVGCETNTVQVWGESGTYPVFKVGGSGWCQTGGAVQITNLNVDGLAGGSAGQLRVTSGAYPSTTINFNSYGLSNYMRGYLNVGDNVVNNATGSVGADSFCLGTGNDCVTTWADNGVFSSVAAGTTSFDFRTTNVFRVSPSATATYTASVGPAGQTAAIIFLSSGTTARTITFGTGFKSVGTLSTGSVTAKYFTVNFVSDGSNMIETSRISTGM